MESKSLFPFSARGTWVGGLTDLTDKKDGIYEFVSRGDAGTPSNLELEYGSVLLFSTNGEVGGSPLVQILVVSYPAPACYIRIKWGSNWHAWIAV